MSSYTVLYPDIAIAVYSRYGHPDVKSNGQVNSQIKQIHRLSYQKIRKIGDNGLWIEQNLVTLVLEPILGPMVLHFSSDLEARLLSGRI